MEWTGRLVDMSRNWNNNQTRLVFEINEEIDLEPLNEIAVTEKLSIKAEPYREKRSLNSNSYCWVLLQKLAEACKTTKEEMYLQCLQRYSRKFTHVIVKADALEYMKSLYRTFIDLGEVKVNGQTGHQLQVYYGSSTFNTKEMTVFLDGIVSECKELGIETMPPEQIERMNATWNQ